MNWMSIWIPTRGREGKYSRSQCCKTAAYLFIIHHPTHLLSLSRKQNVDLSADGIAKAACVEIGLCVGVVRFLSIFSVTAPQYYHFNWPPLWRLLWFSSNLTATPMCAIDSWMLSAVYGRPAALCAQARPFTLLSSKRRGPAGAATSPVAMAVK